MPYYKGNVVTDDFLQGMVNAYRKAYDDAGGQNVEDSDGPILERLENASAEQVGSAALGAEDAKHEASS